ncbi:MAG: TIGR02757 family protein [Rhodothermales bacterium]|nr:TIGR02757 family protein [Rhodothermales bacterium]
MINVELRHRLDLLADEYQQIRYIEHDPIAVPRGFEDPLDIEISGLLAALLAWGRRATILDKLADLCERMSYRPGDFVRSFSSAEASEKLSGFKHRTFNDADAFWLLRNLSLLLNRYGSIEACFAHHAGTEGSLENAIEGFSTELLEIDPDTPQRLRKHLARPSTGSACKRLCMFSRWMVRPGPFDFGIWKAFSPSQLVLPLDVHSGTQARSVGLLSRKTNDWKAALELTNICRTFDAADPCKYDFALFGAGVYGGLEEFAVDGVH